MKEIDETPVPESESERRINECEDCDRLAHHVNKAFGQLREHALVCQARIEALELRVANLETQRTPQDENDDPEWFS